MLEKNNHENVVRLEPLIEAIQKNCDWTKNLLSRFAKAKAEAKAGKPLSAYRKLIQTVQAQPDSPALPTREFILSKLREECVVLVEKGRSKIREELVAEAAGHNLDCKPHIDGVAIGPFLVWIDDDNERAELRYAKVKIGDTLPLAGDQIIAVVQRWIKVINEPIDLDDFQERLEQAIRVRLARNQKQTSITAGRVELPQLYSELEAIAFLSPKRKPYPFLRFLVELKTFLQSDANIKRNRQYRLEPAVIENSNNPAKSVFIPKDLLQGFGESSAYQALLV